MIPNTPIHSQSVSHLPPPEEKARVEESPNSQSLSYLNSLIQKLFPDFPELKGSIEESKPLIDIVLIYIASSYVTYNEEDWLALLQELYRRGFDLNRPFVYASNYQETPPISQNSSYWRSCQHFISILDMHYGSKIQAYKELKQRNLIQNPTLYPPHNLESNLLIAATISLNTRLIRVLLQHYKELGLELNYRDTFGRTALFWGNQFALPLFMENPDVDLKLKNNFGSSIVHFLGALTAQEEGILPLLEKVIAKKVPLFELNFFQKDPLIYAIQSKNYQTVKFLLKQPGYDYSRTYQFEEGFSPISIKILPYACRLYEPSLKTIKHLLQDPNIDPNEPSADQMTPLGHACANGNQKVVETLLKSPKVDPFATIASIPPFYCITRNTHRSVTPLFIACVMNRLPILDQLAAIPGVSPNHQDSNGQTPLHVASIQGYIAVVTKLLSLPNISPNITDAKQYSPIQYAYEQHHFEIVRLLLEHPLINPPSTLPNNEPILSFACRLGWDKAVENLLKRPAIDPNLPFNNLTPLGFALVSQKLETLKILIKNERVKVQIATGLIKPEFIQTSINMLHYYSTSDSVIAHGIQSKIVPFNQKKLIENLFPDIN